MSEETIIGPNACPRCGGEYGDHDRECYKERIRELEGVTQFLDEQRHAMGDLLDRVPHKLGPSSRRPTCTQDCPACAWAKLNAQ